VNIRSAKPEDVDLLMSLVERLESELPDLPYPEDPAEFERGKVERMVDAGVALIAEGDDGNVVGYALARYGVHGPTTVYVSDLWVDSAARGRGIGRELLRRVSDAAITQGTTHVVLDVDSKNRDALAFYERLGFEEGAKILRAEVGVLLREREPPPETVGALHVQTDDAQAVQRVVDEYLPRLVRGATMAVERGRAWTVVRMKPFGEEVLRKLGTELSYRFGVTVLLTLEAGAVVRFVIHDRGRMVDEYLSVPEYFGPLPPGDALALRANPTVVSRLTGADAARVRAVARTADSPGQLPPAEELYAEIAEALGLAP
jgi:ribosomal protein S18 acetylase RimI-like enzyme